MSAPDDYADRAETFQSIHSVRPLAQMIPNLHATIHRLDTAAGALPVTVHDGHAGDAWVCSPRTTYVDYAAEEAVRYFPGASARLAGGLGKTGGALFDATGIDRAVSLNNWLLSTNLYPALAQVDVPALIDQARQRWPKHALWFRSLNGRHGADWLRSLQSAGCQLIASRQVWIYDDLALARQGRADLKRDLALLDRTPLRYCGDQQFEDGDYARIAALYAQLYTSKYSRFNPMYGAEFLRQWHRTGLLELHGFRDDEGLLLTVVGLFRQHDVATAPIVGYDTTLPRSMGLYRLACACAYRRCLEAGWRLNFSAGAAEFKRLRGGQPEIEYSAVYAHHLPRHTRVALQLLSTITRRIGAPLLRRYRL